MHSKWQIWDFFSSVSREFLENFEGTLALSTFDPICLKMVKDYLVRGTNRPLHYKMPAEVTKDWIEEEFQTLSLFGASESFFIHQAQSLPIDILEALSSLEITVRFLILSFEDEGSGWKKTVKNSRMQTIQLEAPKFWETNKLLNFVCAHLRLPLSLDAKSWMLDALENNLPAFYNSCCLIKLNHPEVREVSLSQVKDLLTLEKLDQFAMANLYARKKTTDFFQKVIAFEGDFERMRALFNFLQSHFIKLMDTSYLAQKPRLTQYDRELQSSSRLWKSAELKSAIEQFNRWELMSKKKDTLLWHELKEACLRSY